MRCHSPLVLATFFCCFATLVVLAIPEGTKLDPTVPLRHCAWFSDFLLEWDFSLAPKNTLETRFTANIERNKFTASGFAFYDKIQLATGYPTENLACAQSLYDTYSAYDVDGNTYPRHPELPGALVYANDTHASHYLMRNLSVSAKQMLLKGASMSTNVTILWGYIQASMFSGGCYNANLDPYTEYATFAITFGGSTYLRSVDGQCQVYSGRVKPYRGNRPISPSVPMLDRERNQNRRVAALLVGGDELLLSGKKPPVFDATKGRVMGGENGNGVCQQSLSRIYTRWYGFSDTVGGIKRYLVSIGTPALPSVYVDRYDAGTNEAFEYVPNPTLTRNTSLIVTVRAVNWAGLATKVVSSTVKVLNDGRPLHGWLYDGTSAAGVELDFQYTASTLNAFWGGWRREEHSLINHDTGAITEQGVEYAVGTKGVALNDVRDWTVISSTQWKTQVSIAGLTLTPSQTYTVSIRSKSCASVYTVQTTDGITIDQDAPRPGWVHYGNSSAKHRATAYLSEALEAHWGAFSDVLSGIASYAWAMGLQHPCPDTVGNALNKFPWTNVGLSTKPRGPRLHTFSGFTLGTKFYIYVKATDNVGNSVVITSNATTIAFIT